MLLCSNCGTDIKMTLTEVQESEQIDCYGCGETLKSRVDPVTAKMIAIEKHDLEGESTNGHDGH